MRGNVALVSLLIAGLLVGAGPATGEQSAGPTSGLPEEVEGGVIVDLAEGDRFKATVSRDMRTVWGSRYDAATRTWGARVAILREKDLFCGRVDARAAGEAVALIAECGQGGWYEDGPMTDSRALYSPDTISWQSFTLPGEAYEEPGISPSGNHAIWSLGHGWVTWSAAGFSVAERELPGQGYSVTGTISDAGDVSVLYGHMLDQKCNTDECESGVGRNCVLTVLTIEAATASEAGQQLDVEYACVDVSLANADATTVLLGRLDSPESIVTITRPDTASPWSVTGIAPEDAPGLVPHRGRGTASTLFVDSPGLPLLAVGSGDKRTFTAQAYDPMAQRWSAAQPIRSSSTGCALSGNFHHEPLGVFALQLDCRKSKRVLISTDAHTWHDVAIRRSPLGVSPDRAYVSVTSRSRTQIFSRERGRVILPLSTRARCDVIQPVSPDSLVRLTSTSKRGWPNRLDESTSSRWQRTTTPFPRLKVALDRCNRRGEVLHRGPVGYSFYGQNREVELAVAPRGDGWTIQRVDY